MNFSLNSYGRSGCILSLGLSVYMCMLSCFSCIQFFMTLWTVACQAPLSMGLSRQEYWSGLPCPSPGRVSQYSIHNSIIAMISSPCKFCSHCAHFSIKLVKMFVWFFSPKLWQSLGPTTYLDIHKCLSMMIMVICRKECSWSQLTLCFFD